MKHLQFRGISKDTDQWIYGRGVYMFDERAFIIHTQGMNMTHMTEVIPETVGQFIGKQDKAGVDIYSGDILAIRADMFSTGNAGHEVVFGDYCIGLDDWGLEHKTPCFCIKFKDGSGYHRIDDEMLVIGNKFNNPELLELS